ncbi:TPA: SAM-dependent methyltransferase [bacterium]|nr:SAM-dependent methyltransferase [bacterium]
MIDDSRLRQCVKDFNFENLFIEELGWDRHRQNLDVTIDNQTFSLSAVAEKRGMVAFICQCNIPLYAIRRKIEQQVTKSVHEHIIIFIDNARTTQIWQWVKREIGKPTASREHQYYHTQSGESLIQKLRPLAFSLDEEEELNLFGVTSRVSSALDVERVTKRFYERFKTEHAKFLDFINGIPDGEIKRHYASVMINRLMFIYFIQKKGFIDNDTNYLSTKLAQSKRLDDDRFYANFICPLFFEGFAKKEEERSPEIQKLLGKVPYLNGGIFLKHQIEELHGEQINIPDSAFEKLFSFFGQYNWHLDERPLRRDDEINPDVLGYIFEKYINQKQMGAYYTKEDITEYISKNTIIPSLFDTAQKKCKVAFTPPTDNSPDMSVWRLLQTEPDKYIYDAVKKGVGLPLPENIAVGLDDVSKRTDWNKTAPEEYALPTEIWREVVARRKRYEEIRSKLANGEINDINDLITYNLNIRQFAQDVIENCEGPDLLRAFWQAITQITVLDPTCGSGAFLFSALNILDSLYEACIDRMESFVSELDRSEGKHHPEKYSDFRKTIEQIEKHPNRRYFVLKSIILNNLYGVDIMDEAIEICKLRLFLKLVAQVESVDDIEPLPDIDFNIRAGNTLVGFATYDEIKKAITSNLDFTNAMERIEEKAQDVDRLSESFRKQQTEYGGEITHIDKQNLRSHLKALEDELNRYLAVQYGVNPNKKADYDKWLDSHKPFHWFIDFHSIMNEGGFDVIIGNPPYVEYSKVRNIYEVKDMDTLMSGNLYSFIIERSIKLQRNKSYNGMIIPLSAYCTDRMDIFQEFELMNCSKLYLSNFSERPCKLFEGAERNLTIALFQKDKDSKNKAIFTTCLYKWYANFREYLFDNISYINAKETRIKGIIPKISCPDEISILLKLRDIKKNIGYFTSRSKTNNILYYRNSGGRYWKIITDFQPAFFIDNKKSISSRESYLYFADDNALKNAVSIFNSTIYYWYYIMHSDARTNNPSDLKDYPIDFVKMSETHKKKISELCDILMEDLDHNSIMQPAKYRTGNVEFQQFFPQHSKPIIDEIDRVLAEHYGFTDEELDFIINYDIKYRMGRDSEENEE